MRGFFEMATQPYYIYGIHPVSFAVKNNYRKIQKILFTKDAAAQKLDLPKNIRLEPVEKTQLQKLVGHDAVHQGIAALIHPLEPLSLEELGRNPSPNQLVMILDQVTDPHNIGAILRTCAVFDVKALILTDRHAPQESGTLAKAACGALELVPMIRIPNLAQALIQLKDMGFWTVGLAETGDQTLTSINWKGKMAIIMGAEGDGMRQLTKKHCDFLVHLETSPTFSTLNVSNAAAITLYEAFKGQRG